METYYDTIVLSPHLDDAALSCGGQIYQQATAGLSVLVITIMAGDSPTADVSKFAQHLHDRWELHRESTARRREEDRAACQILGSDYLHWTIPDCIYRHNPQTGEQYYNSDEDIFGPVHPDDIFLQETLARNLAKLPTHKRILAPLTVGNHVDHQITRAAAESCFGRELIYYEEYPYAAEPGAVESVVIANRDYWHSSVVPISQGGIEKKTEAIAAYVSQMSSFFLDRADMQRQVHDYSQLIGGERIWWIGHNAKPLQ